MLFGTGGDQTPVCQDHIDGEEIVNGEATCAGQMAEPATQGQSAHASGGDNATGCGQAKSMRGVIDISPGAAPLNTDRACCGVDANALHAGEVDDQTIITRPQTTAIVAATPHGDEHVVLASVMDRGHHVGDIGTPHDQARIAVNHAIIDLASCLVTRIMGLQQLTA